MRKNLFFKLVTVSVLTVLSFCTFAYALLGGNSVFQSSWPVDMERVWIGPEYWANRLQDWRISKGRLECVEAGKPMRTVHLLTNRLGDKQGQLSMSVRLGLVDDSGNMPPNRRAGFLIGAGGQLDYRAAALIHHTPGLGGGIFAGIDGQGRLFIRDFSLKMDNDKVNSTGAGRLLVQSKPTVAPNNIELNLSVKPVGDKYQLQLQAKDIQNGRTLDEISLESIEANRLVGNVALASSGKFWFRDWQVEGGKVEANDEQLCGPVLCTQYTLHNNIMKMTAQMMPIGVKDAQTVSLQIKKLFGWKTIATTKIIVPGYTATFKVENWNSNKNVPYRVVYDLKQADRSTKAYTWSGTVRRDPVDKEQIVVAAFTGNHNLAHPGVERGIPWTKDGVWFPHNDIFDSVGKHKPDVLFFSGDQVYELSSPTRPVKSPLDKALLDYLYKWYLWCWAFRDMAKDTVCICIPDDHDVYQGNLWGAGGRKIDNDNKGGYVMDAEWVKMIERTQTSHLPDAYDPTPIEQGINVYYTAMNYGRISFAVLEDRKFKSGCAGLVPETKSGRPDHVKDPNFDPRTADVPGATLLGQRQLRFLEDWASDWRGVDMKAALSQTVFANVATIHGPEKARLVVDYDSNGWPQTGRNKALAIIRKAFGFMICGDQHLSTIVHHGIDDWRDAGYSFCVPSIANFYPRAWLPLVPGKNRVEGMPDYTGDFLDGLGNHVTVWAATNPRPMGKNPAELHDKMPGYGIVRFNKKDRTITIECWPRYADPADPKTGSQYEGWPKMISQMDNYGRKAIGYLPKIEVSGKMNPVVQVINQADEEVVYTLRIGGNVFEPKVFKAGLYTVKVGEPGTNKMKVFKDIHSLQDGEEAEAIKLKL